MKPTASAAELATLAITHRTVIPEDYIDLMGHMNVMWYTHLFGNATFTTFQQVGLTREYFQANQRGTFALGQLFTYLVEVREGEEVTIRTRVLGRSARKLHMMHFMTKGAQELLACTNEFLAAHVDMRIRRTSDFPPEIAGTLDRLVAAHAALGWEPPISGAMAP
jgi:acyl-CoA thioester hydrolase